MSVNLSLCSTALGFSTPKSRRSVLTSPAVAAVRKFGELTVCNGREGGREGGIISLIDFKRLEHYDQTSIVK